MADRSHYRDDRGYPERSERPVSERAGDEVRSWFGDDEAARRRRMDELRNERHEDDWRDSAGYSAQRTWDRARETSRDWTDRDRDGRRGLAEFADNDRASYYSGYRRPAYQDDWNRDRHNYRNREQSFGDTSRYGNPDRYGYGRPSPEFGRPYGRATSEWDQANYAGRGPRGYKRSDQRILEEVCDRLTDDPRIDASDIEVNVKSGEVTLAGSVRTREEKRYAEELVERLSGVREVNNHLKVKPPTEVIGTARSGASLLGLSDTPPPQSESQTRK